jgi:ligand-binding sensor domain-containing protein
MRYVMNILEFPQRHLLIHSDDQVVERHPRSMFDGRAIPVQSIYVDSDNGLWVSTQGKRLCRIAGQRVEHYGIRDGVSSDSVNKSSEDRKGNVWVATQEGLDRFRDDKVAEEVNSMFEDRHGRMWVDVDKRPVR